MNLLNGRVVRSLAALSIASILAVSTLHAAESSPASGNIKEKYRELVVNFLDLAMNKHQVPEAANRYLTEAYIQHNPNVADGRQAFIDAFAVFLKKNPDRKSERVLTGHFFFIFPTAPSTPLFSSSRADSAPLRRSSQASPPVRFRSSSFFRAVSCLA